MLVLTVALLAGAAAAGRAEAGDAARSEGFTLRGHALTLRLYGTRGAPSAIVTSGDGGWVHLGPDVARFLAAEGLVRRRLRRQGLPVELHQRPKTLDPADVPTDYAALADYAAQGRAGAARCCSASRRGQASRCWRPAEPEVQRRIAGIVALGLPDKNELGWRFRDSMIYLTKKTPQEPLFSAREHVSRVSPVPLALVRSPRDEFVPAEESDAIWAAAREPRRLWAIDAADHRFSDKQPELRRALKEAIAWILQQQRASR